MQRISTMVIQKLLDGFFLGLDVIDETRRRIDRVLGRPEEVPFEVVWPQEDVETAAASSSIATAAVNPAPAPGNGATSPPKKTATAAKSKSKSTASTPVRTSKKSKNSTVKKRAPASRPKVPAQVDTLAQAVLQGTAGLIPLETDRELGGKRMIARVVYALAAAQNKGLEALSSTEIAHVLTFGLDIETFGTNISRAIRQGTAGLVEPAPTKGKEPKRYRLSDEGRSTSAREFTDR